MRSWQSVQSLANEFLISAIRLYLRYVQIAPGIGADAMGTAKELPSGQEMAGFVEDRYSLLPFGNVDDAFRVDVNAGWLSQVFPLQKISTIGIEDLDAIITTVCNENSVFCVYSDAVWEIKLT